MPCVECVVHVCDWVVIGFGMCVCLMMVFVVHCCVCICLCSLYVLSGVGVVLWPLLSHMVVCLSCVVLSV